MHSSTLLALLAPLSLASSLQSSLNWDVFLAPPVPVYNPPQNLTFSPTAFTLIHGPNAAILVDAPLTTNTTNALAGWISSTVPNKTFTYV